MRQLIKIFGIKIFLIFIADHFDLKNKSEMKSLLQLFPIWSLHLYIVAGISCSNKRQLVFESESSNQERKKFRASSNEFDSNYSSPESFSNHRQLDSSSLPNSHQVLSCDNDSMSQNISNYDIQEFNYGKFSCLPDLTITKGDVQVVRNDVFLSSAFGKSFNAISPDRSEKFDDSKLSANGKTDQQDSSDANSDFFWLEYLTFLQHPVFNELMEHKEEGKQIQEQTENVIQVDYPLINEWLQDINHESLFTQKKTNQNSSLLSPSNQITQLQQYEPKYYIQKIPNIFKIILSWFKNDVESKRFRSVCSSVLPTPKDLYFGTNNLKYFIHFKYVERVFHLMYSKNEILLMNWAHSQVNNAICVIFQTFLSLPTNFKPMYYYFESSNANDYCMRNYLRIPYYFFFTTLSYLILNEESDNKESLVSLLEQAYLKILKNTPLHSNNWLFLRKFLGKYFTIPSEIKVENKNYLRYDILTISFIYNEMTMGKSDQVKQLFTRIWKAGKKQFIHERIHPELYSNPFIILLNDQYRKCSYEFTLHKFYQLKFTELIFGKWKTIDCLLDKYSELKLHFKLILIDFRLRMFSLVDFELLDESLNRIALLLTGHSFTDLKVIESFFTELECFIFFKCILFVRDFCTAVERIRNSTIYQSSFIFIKSIYEKFKNIRETLSKKNVTLRTVDYGSAESKIPFSFESLIENLPQFAEHFDVEQVKQCSKFKELSIGLPKFDNFNLNCLSEISTIQQTEFLVELKMALDSEIGIEEIFQSDKYKEVRRLWNYNLDAFQLTLREKKKYLELFRHFLILYSQ